MRHLLSFVTNLPSALAGAKPRSTPTSRRRRLSPRARRRAVASILAMMFLVIFASLASVMAVVAQGNLRTADSHLKVSRSMSAAETGLTFASRRLLESAQRFVVEKGVIDDDFGTKLWLGTWEAGDGAVEILPPVGFEEDDPASSLATALMNAHDADLHNLIINPGDELLPAMDEFGKVVVRPIGLTTDADTPTFQLSYQPLENGQFIRVTSVGRDGDLSRTIQMDFQVLKRLDAAIISPNRVMIGKNVHIDGPIGSRYGEDPLDLEEDNGHPLVIRSDFMHLDDELDVQITALVTAIAAYDVDGDNRLRPGHPTEAAGLTEDYMVDADSDGYVDDYDLWLGFYDESGDNQICYDSDLASDAGYGNLTEEFVDIDNQLVEMIDSLKPDRNGDGIVDADDTVLGYLDGVINSLDAYSKVSGHLLFKAVASEWETAQNIDYQSVVLGPIHPDVEVAAAQFEVDDNTLYDLTIADFTNSQDALKTVAEAGDSFDAQLESQLGEDPAGHVWSDHPTDPDYLRPDLGQWEQMPLGSPGFYDYYQRSICKNMTFVDVVIPMGTNALFINCSFVGAIYVEAYTNNDHVNWNYLGMKDFVGGVYVDKYDFEFWEPVLEIDGDPVYDTKPFSNNLRFHDCTVIGSIVSDALAGFTHVRNKLQFTGNSRFTLDPDEIDNTNLSEAEKQAALNSFNTNFPELQKSSLMAPNYSVDVGTFSNEDSEVNLSGTIVAGVLDVRGTASVKGTLLMTYKPTADDTALFYGGSPAAFNTTIGYFTSAEGDGEGGENFPETGFGAITVTYDPSIPLPDGIMAPIKVLFVSGSYREGGSL